MNVNVTPTSTTPVEKKTRTITLTNRAPIQIVEDDWPIIAEGMCGEWDESSPFSWKIEIRVRKDKHARTIIHANYTAEGADEEDYARARTGRLHSYPALTGDGLWKEMQGVAEELRSRIDHPKHANAVTLALDNCFASLAPMKY